MKYTEVQIHLSELDPWRDMLMYSMGEEGPYDSFDETPWGLKAYVPTEAYDAAFVESSLESLKELNSQLQASYEALALPDKDYNEEWERQHEPVLVEGFCYVRAPFHPHREDVRYEIVIEPKMSFGTAHHATTRLMLSLLEKEEVVARRVLDMGSGTGVLAILAAKKGASYVEAIDVDEWAYRNAQENFACNNVQVNALLGDASLLTEQKHFDVVLANINRNILLRDMVAYQRVLTTNGVLIMSGFYEHDITAIVAKAEALGLRFVEQRVDGEWAAVRVIKD
ncbi:MAG: 50S ribosomal protein L11 methyltransferase [Bacteroidales bacterium]|nr:50S ribosomal protein L11 methyltransferase [Bacteroidales bacterium]